MNIHKTTPTTDATKHITAIHGWGFNSAVWNDIGDRLKTDYCFSAVDLPGFGRSPMLEGEYTLPVLADFAIEAVPSPSVLMGWSLGGMVALEMARRYPDRVEALVMVASSPRFTETRDWPHGVAPDVLKAFSETLAENPQAALSRFLILQAGRTDLGRVTVKKLKPLLFRYGVPNRNALKEGLALLRETDLRHVLGTIRCPVLFILGARDNLLSPTVVMDLQQLCSNCQATVIDGSAHAPFISHPVEFLQVLTGFLQDVC
uniref:Pimeloyl-[acyl-carrier protein] methyl ester esterase n=1 Tax=Candidatus Kentrum sp. TUN TaxID=2126343 RepID=A0A450ZGP2_9GAMM|nr:MAG: pimeloyl-[acyl-carrier protein] methyl ester esterase [Candidatus Kentron sp. TUN]VFK52983.1 MAG: pimeloyl-[acyl-carrier protein] methyl ester esterase [Candidatus Kentron sp. TUN]VFK57947.1 MAG: pimeloyl-[acyl-carrier protein] methyl ester esterase [Candidatus Kentron sp. TUN]